MRLQQKQQQQRHQKTMDNNFCFINESKAATNSCCSKCSSSNYGILEYRINFDHVIRLCSNPLCEQKIDFNESKGITKNDLSNATIDEILNNTEKFITNEIDELNKILFYTPPEPVDSKHVSVAAKEQQQQQPILNEVKQVETIINDYNVFNENFMDFLDDLLPDQLLQADTNQQFYDATAPVYQYLPPQESVVCTSDSFISSITEGNNLIYNDVNTFSNDSNTSSSQAAAATTAPVFKSNSSIVITKLSDIDASRNIMPIFEGLVIRSIKDDRVPVVASSSQPPPALVAQSNKNETIEDDKLLPWERGSKRMKIKPTRENEDVLKRTMKPSGITKKNLSSKIKDQQFVLASKEKGTALKNALLQEPNHLLNSLKSMNTTNGNKQQQQATSSYRDLVFNVLKKKSSLSN